MTRSSKHDQQRILKRGNKMTLNLPDTGKLGRSGLNLQAQPAPRKLVRTSKSEGQRWNSTTSRSPTIDTLRNSFKNLGEKVESRRRGTSNWCWSFEDRRIESGDCFMSTTMKACHSSWTKITFQNLELHRNTNFEELQNFFDITQRLILDHQAEISECDTDWLDSSLMDEIYTYSRPGDHVDGSLSTRLLGFRLMLGWKCQSMQKRIKDEKKQGEEFRQPQFLQRTCLGNWWRNRLSSSGIFFPGLALLEILQKKPQRPCKIENTEPGEVWRSNHHVNVQWHRVDKERKVRKHALPIPKKSLEFREEKYCEDTGRSSALETKRSGTENSQFTHLKPRLTDGGNDSKKPVISESTQRSSRAPRCLCEWRFRIVWCIHRMRFSLHLKWRQQKVYGCHSETSRTRRTRQQTQYQLTPRSKWKMHRRYWKIPKPECPEIGIHLPKTQMAKNHGPVWKIQSFPLERKSVRSSSAYSLNEKKRLFLVCVCGRYKNWLGRKQNIDPIPRTMFIWVCTQRAC